MVTIAYVLPLSQILCFYLTCIDLVKLSYSGEVQMWSVYVLCLPEANRGKLQALLPGNPYFIFTFVPCS